MVNNGEIAFYAFLNTDYVYFNTVCRLDKECVCFERVVLRHWSWHVGLWVGSSQQPVASSQQSASGSRQQAASQQPAASSQQAAANRQQ